MKSKFKLGDIFTLKGTRDMIPLKIYDIAYKIEPEYSLKPMRGAGDEVILGEEALIKLYNKHNYDKSRTA